jgi:hypothetical protein
LCPLLGANTFHVDVELPIPSSYDPAETLLFAICCFAVADENERKRCDFVQGQFAMFTCCSYCMSDIHIRLRGTLAIYHLLFAFGWRLGLAFRFDRLDQFVFTEVVDLIIVLALVRLRIR